MATTKAVDNPFAIKADGSAEDPAAFREALRADEEKMAALRTEPEALKVVEGDDLQAFQVLLKTVYAVRCRFSAHSCAT